MQGFALYNLRMNIKRNVDNTILFFSYLFFLCT